MINSRRGIHNAAAGARPVAPREVARGVRPRGRGATESEAAPSSDLKPCIAYLLIDFGRPMAWIPPLALLKPGMLVQIWAIYALFSRGLRRGIPRPLWYMIGFLPLMALQVPLAVNNAWAFFGFRDYLFLVLGGVLPLAMLPRDLRDVRKLATVYFLCHIPAAIYGLLHGGRGVDGWMGDENDLALALNAALGVGVYLLNEARGFGRKLLLIASIGLMVAAVVSTKSRGGFVGFAALGLYMLLAGPKRGRVLVAVILVAVCLAAFAPPAYWGEIRSIKGSDQEGDTGEQRMYMWGMAWRMFLDNPIIGVGTRNFGIRASDYESKERAEFGGFHVWGRVAHSLYFTLISEHGVVGVVLFSLLLFWIFRTSGRLRREGRKVPDDPDAVAAGLLAAGLTSGIVAMLITGIFLSVLYYPVLWVLSGILASLDAVRRESVKAAAATPNVVQSSG